MTTLTINKPRPVFSQEHLIAPYTLDQFIDQYMEQQQLIVSRDDPGYYEKLFSIDNVDQVLDVSRPRDESLRIVKKQVPLMPAKYQNKDGSLNLNQIYAAYADGHTVVINGIDRFWSPLRKLCQNISEELSYHAKANMYLTPKNQNALLPHYDTHDVYVLQIHGSKHWRFYDAPVETPMLFSHQPIFKREQLRNMREVTLNPGDFMYMPRGLPHEAYTTDKSSLHITIGIYPTQWCDLISKAIQQMALQNPEFRKALPAGFLRPEKWDEAFSQDFNDKFRFLLKQFEGKSELSPALGLIAEDYRNDYTPKGDGHFRMLDKIDEIDLNSRLCRREDISSTVQITGPFCRIIFPGNVIKGPRHIAKVFQFISEAEGAFQLSELPVLNDSNKIKLAARLIRGGLLRVV